MRRFSIILLMFLFFSCVTNNTNVHESLMELRLRQYEQGYMYGYTQTNSGRKPFQVTFYESLEYDKGIAVLKTFNDQKKLVSILKLPPLDGNFPIAVDVIVFKDDDQQEERHLTLTQDSIEETTHPNDSPWKSIEIKTTVVSKTKKYFEAKTIRKMIGKSVPDEVFIGTTRMFFYPKNGEMIRESWDAQGERSSETFVISKEKI